MSAAAVVLAVAGVLSASPAAAEPPGAAPATPQTWTDCARFLNDPAAPPSAQCATVTVPVDYAQPGGPTADLAVIRVPATGQRLGTLMINPGGPGGSAVDAVAETAAQLAATDIGRRFDLVGFDPRGVGHSTPQARCRTDAELDAYRREPLADFSPAGVARIEALYRDLAARCVARLGEAFLANLGTATTVRDMDMVRAALGEEQLSYLGFSYGTSLGGRYASAYPQRVRAMVLDGAIDPTTDPVTAEIAQVTAFQRAFDRYARYCMSFADCPLGNDPAQASARYRALLDPLVARPAATSDPRGLSYADAYTGTLRALYSPRYWDFLTSGLLGLSRGTDPGDLLLLADDYFERDQTGRYTAMADSFVAIRCLDNAFPRDPGPWVAANEQIRRAAPFASYGGFTGFAPRDVCALWPVPPTSAPAPVTSPGPGTVVVVSTTGDPATPYDDGVALARQLDASLITYEGDQHTVVFTGEDCVDQAVERFLVDRVAPPPGLRC